MTEEATLKFCLVEIENYLENPTWVEDLGTHYKDYWNKIVSKDRVNKIIDKVETSGDFEVLDWKRTGLVNNRLYPRYGWLSPNGDFYGCRKWGHEVIARLFFKKKSLDMITFGWVQIREDDYYADICNDLTPNQKFWMKNNKIEF
jgi:hypothetical protein